MKYLCFSILSIMFFSACSSTLFIKNDEASFKELNNNLVGEEVTVRFLNGDEIDGMGKKINSDITIIDSTRLTTNEIKEIYIYSHGKGFLKGLGYGAFGAFTVGALIGVLTYDPKESHGFIGPSSYGDAALMTGTLFGVPGLLIGGIIGGINGDPERFVFPLTNKEYKSAVSLEISEFVKTHRNYIIIKWKGKVIRLLRAEYKYGEKTKDGKQIIFIPNEVFLKKF
jgi:hypothetical protein